MSVPPPQPVSQTYTSSYVSAQLHQSGPLYAQSGSNVNQQSSYTPHNPTNTLMSDISRFMFRKDFLLSRFSNFDDKPESFEAWRASFQSIIRELGVSPFEEMDLLIKWLGLQSSQFAKFIRIANAHDPPRGVAKVWERLRE